MLFVGSWLGHIMLQPCQLQRTKHRADQGPYSSMLWLASTHHAYPKLTNCSTSNTGTVRGSPQCVHAWLAHLMPHAYQLQCIKTVLVKSSQSGV